MKKQIVRKHLISAIIEVDGIRTDDADLNEELEKMYVPDCFAEKFAELIVRDCINAIDDGEGLVSSMAENCWRQVCVKEIKQHFGVDQ